MSSLLEDLLSKTLDAHFDQLRKANPPKVAAKIGASYLTVGGFRTGPLEVNTTCKCHPYKDDMRKYAVDAFERELTAEEIAQGPDKLVDAHAAMEDCIDRLKSIVRAVMLLEKHKNPLPYREIVEEIMDAAAGIEHVLERDKA